MRYLYRAFDLNIESEIALKSLNKADPFSDPDLKITYGKVIKPKDLLTIDHYEVTQDLKNIFLNYLNYPIICIKEDKEIVINSELKCYSKEIEIYVLATSLATILIRKGYLLLHGATLFFDNKAYLFLGPKGVGKSTLALGLKARGYQVIGDDICAIKYSADNSLLLVKSVPTIKVKENTNFVLDLNLDNSQLYVDQKYWLHLDQPEDEHYKIEGIYSIDVSEDLTEVIYESSSGISKMDQLMQNLYRPEVISSLKLWKQNFTMLKELSSCVVQGTIKRPENGFSLDKIIDIIEDEILNLEIKKPPKLGNGNP